MSGSSLTYAEALAAIESRGRYGIRLGLGRVRALLRELGDPQLDVRGALVAGTNGKGQRHRARERRAPGGRLPRRRDAQATPRDVPGADRRRRPPDRPGRLRRPGRGGAAAGGPRRPAARPADRVRAADRRDVPPLLAVAARPRPRRGRPRRTPGRDERVGRRRGGPDERRAGPHGPQLGPTIAAIAREKVAIVEAGRPRGHGRGRGGARDHAPALRATGCPAGRRAAGADPRLDSRRAAGRCCRVSGPWTWACAAGTRRRTSRSSTRCSTRWTRPGSRRSPADARRRGYADARWPGRLELVEARRPGGPARRRPQPGRRGGPRAALDDLAPHLAGPVRSPSSGRRWPTRTSPATVRAVAASPLLDGATVICTAVDVPRALPARCPRGGVA